MRTENGRKTRAENAEITDILSRKFVCGSCGEKAQIKSKQFGEEVRCLNCNGEMFEVKD